MESQIEKHLLKKKSHWLKGSGAQIEVHIGKKALGESCLVAEFTEQRGQSPTVGETLNTQSKDSQWAQSGTPREDGAWEP